MRSLLIVISLLVIISGCSPHNAKKDTSYICNEIPVINFHRSCHFGYDNPKITCSKLPYVFDYIGCVYGQALAQGSDSVCDELRVEHGLRKASNSGCRIFVAGAIQDIEICNKLDGSYKSDCVYFLAKHAKTLDECTQLNTTDVPPPGSFRTVEKDCHAAVFINNDDLASCYTFEDKSDYRDYCVSSLAKNAKDCLNNFIDRSRCIENLKIKDSNYSICGSDEDCLVSFAIQLRDITLCSNVTSTAGYNRTRICLEEVDRKKQKDIEDQCNPEDVFGVCEIKNGVPTCPIPKLTASCMAKAKNTPNWILTPDECSQFNSTEFTKTCNSRLRSVLGRQGACAFLDSAEERNDCLLKNPAILDLV